MSTPTPVPSPEDLEAVFAEDLFPPLTGNDRCDADAAETAVAQVLMGDTVLKFCGSHWRKFSGGDNGLAKFPHSVPDEDSLPFTHRRAAELGGSQTRSQGDDHA